MKNSLTTASFDSYCIIGFTQSPYRQSSDTVAFLNLFNEIIGENGTVMADHSFHPYQLINTKGLTVWQWLYTNIAVNSNADGIYDTLKNEHAKYLLEIGEAFSDSIIWRDKRLSTDLNSKYAKYVPFVLPFLIPHTTEKLKFEREMDEEKLISGVATGYLNKVSQLIQFLLPSPSFVIGITEFDEKNPGELINHFEQALEIVNV